MRIRKKKHLSERLGGVSDMVIVPPRDILNVKEAVLNKVYFDYAEIFGNDNPVELEVGCGKGGFIIKKALENMDRLGLEGLLLSTDKGPVAMTLGSRLSEDTVDVHFEKAFDFVDGAYPAINHGFANYLREKYPQLRFLNREDDMGLEGLRRAKEIYCPHHLVEKWWACLREEGYDY